MSRKKLIPVIRPSAISRTWSDHGSSPPSALGLYCPNAGMPFASTAMSLEPRQPIPGSQAPRDDVVVGLQPHLVRRHRPGGVLAQERRERLHVVPLERVDVAVEQRALHRRRRARRVSASSISDGLEGRARALQGAVHRRDRGVEQLGHLGRLPAQDLSEDQHRPLPRRQVLQRGHEREPDRLARLEHLGGIAALGHHAIVGHGQDPHVLRAAGRAAGCPRIVAGASSIGRARRSLPPSMSRQTFVTMLYSHERNDDRPSNCSKLFHARRNASCTASSASNPEPSIR